MEQAKVEALAVALSAEFIAAGIPAFDPDKFLSGTKLPDSVTITNLDGTDDNPDEGDGTEEDGQE